MKKIFLFAAAAALFAACSNSDELATAQAPEAVQGEIPVGFEAYAMRSVTRAGATGDINLDKLKTNGFGVFAYYTDNNDYDQMSTPNFMYNEKVTFESDKWTYSPIKYWPNEYGSTAMSEDYDRVSFFAYAPHVEVTPSTGKLASDAGWGIAGLSRNSAAGDPLVKYIVSFDKDQQVDLLWGVAGKDENVTWTTKDGGTQTFLKGFPWLNVQRPAAGTAMKFQFNHALANLNVQVDATVNNFDGSDDVKDGYTKVFIRSISFTGFALKGALNLNNTDGDAAVAKWLSFDGITEVESGQDIVIYDGMKDGKEGSNTVASNEKVTGLNPQFVQNAAWASSAKGVVKAAANLFNMDNVTDGIYVIPTGEEMKVTIAYDIETKDDKLSTYVSDGAQHGSSIPCTVTQTISNFKLENGKKYLLKLHLGLNSVKFDADVTDWVDQTSSSSEGNLPAN